LASILGKVKSFLDRFMENRDTETPTKPVTPKKSNNVTYNDLDVFKLPEGQGRWTLVLGAEGQGKTRLVKEVAKRFEHSFAYVEATQFEPVKDVDLLIIDDLHKAEQSKIDEIMRFVCGARHDNIKYIICVTQELKGIDAAMIRRFKVVAFFYSAKQHMKLQTIVEGGLKEASEFANNFIRLQPYYYVLYDVQTGFTKNPPLYNLSVDLLIEAMDKPMAVTEAPKPKVKKAKIKDGVKKTYVVASYTLMHPEIKYNTIASKFGVTIGYVKKVKHRLVHGQIKLTSEQVERIAQQYD